MRNDRDLWQILIAEYEPAEPEPEPARVVYHGHHYVEVDGKIYVEPGYFAVEDCNRPGWIETFATKDDAQKWVEHLEEEGCAPSRIYEGSTMYYMMK